MQTVETRVRLHKAQAEFSRSDALFRGFVGGRGAGKTWVGAYDLIRRAGLADGTYLVGSPTGVLLADTTYPTFKAIAKDLGRWPGPSGVRMSPYPNVTLTTGATVRFRTAEDPERMRGPNLSGVWLDEASLMPLEAYHVNIASLRENATQGWLTATFTPKGRHHWTYQVFGSGRPDSALFCSPTRANPFLPPEFADTIRRQYPDVMARQELEGEFIEDGLGYLFPDEWLNRAERLANALAGKPRKAKAMGVDPAEGGDQSAWAIVDELGLIDLVSMKTPDTNVIPSTTLKLMRQYAIPADMVVFDRGGGGKEHADRLRAAGHPVRTVAFGESVTPEPRRGHARIAERLGQREERTAYRNRRAQLYGQLRELLDPTQPGFALPRQYTELRRQLAPIPLLYDGEGRLELPPKNRRPGNTNKVSLVELLGRSPDESDALVLGIFAMLNKTNRPKAGAV